MGDQGHRRGCPPTPAIPARQPPDPCNKLDRSVCRSAVDLGRTSLPNPSRSLTQAVAWCSPIRLSPSAALGDNAVSRRARTSKALLLASDRAERTISLALQGGGAHGAFTWGVLDAILEDGRLAIEAITGTSAGAMNAVILADGWIEGGVEGARTQLEAFWRRVSLDGGLTDIQRTLFDRYLGFWCPDGSPAPPLA